MNETATRDRTVREANTLTPGKTIKERRVCDWCEKTNPPIRECAITLSKTATRWYDLCPDCIQSGAPLQSLLAAPQPRQGASAQKIEERYGPLLAMIRNEGRKTCKEGEEKFVYFLQSGDAVKVGVSRSVSRRALDIQASSPLLVRLLKVVKGDYTLENQIHQWFRDINTHGEWFEATSDLLSFIKSIPSDIHIDPENYHKPPCTQGVLIP